MSTWHQDNFGHSNQGVPEPRGLRHAPVMFVDSVAFPRQESDTSTLREYGGILRKKLLVIALFGILGLIAGVLYSLTITETYRASGTIEIIVVTDDITNRKYADATASSYSSEVYLQTQADILQSKSMIQRVIAQLKLHERPELLIDNDRIATLRSSLGFLPPPQAAREQQPIAIETAGAIAQGKLTVTPRRGTSLVDVQYEANDPQIAAAFVNTLASAFVDYNLELRANSNQRTMDWLGRELRAVEQKLEDGEKQLQAYARRSDLMYTGEGGNIADEKLRQVQVELSKAQAERAQKQSEMETAAASVPDSVPMVSDSELLREHKRELSRLRRELAELTAALTPSHYKVKRVEAQVTELEDLAQKERKNVLARITKEYDSAVRREQLLSGLYQAQRQVVSDQAGKAINYRMLKDQVETYRSLYNNMLQKVRETHITSAMHASNARIVDGAEVPSSPYQPQTPLNAAIGSMFGSLLAAITILFRTATNNTVQAPGELLNYLPVPELGVIPSHAVTPPTRLTRLLSNGDFRLPISNDSDPLFEESFRAVATSILFASGRPRVLVITSPGPGEGKSTVASYLGRTLASLGLRVLVIDADMQQPKLQQIFELPNKTGLSTLLGSDSPITESSLKPFLCTTSVPGLTVLPAGPALRHAATLLYSDRTEQLIAYSRSRYDLVLIDTPPVLQLTDVRMVARYADGAILVVHSGRTDREAAVLAGRRLLDDGVVVLGTVLNGFDTRNAYGYYASGYSAGA